MNTIKSMLFAVVILTITVGTSMAQISKDDYKVLNYTTAIENGKPLEKNLLLKNDENVIANVTLRDGKSLGMHTEDNAFWVAATAGSGQLILGKNEKVIELKPGTIVTVNPGIPHDVVAKPDLSILVIKFLDGKGKKK